jgi:predicted Rossmann fold flavoprotein
MRVIVIGAGAAGVFAAIRAAELGASVAIWEAGRQALAKVRISGGGRCNVSTAVLDPRELVQQYPRGSKELLGPFRRFGPREMQDWLAARGVELKTEADGRVFPVSDDSATIVDCLLTAAQEAGVALHLGRAVQGVVRTAEGFLVSGEGVSETCDHLLLASGGGPGGHRLAAQLGHRLVPAVPSLFTFTVQVDWLRELAGLSVERARLTIEGLAEPLSAAGPLLITHWGLSGPAVLRASAWGARLLHASGYCGALRIDWSGRGRAAVQEALRAEREGNGRQQVAAHPACGLPKRLWQALCLRSGLTEGRQWAALTRAEAAALLDQVSECQLPLQGKGVFKEEFVTAGGVACAEIDWRRMASRVCPGLFLAGEVIDVDGITGGFNFSAAWTTGFIAGSACGEPARSGPV